MYYFIDTYPRISLILILFLTQIFLDFKIGSHTKESQGNLGVPKPLDPRAWGYDILKIVDGGCPLLHERRDIRERLDGGTQFLPHRYSMDRGT